MQFCQSHWNQLRAAIDSRGLSGLVAKNGQEMVQRMGSELAGTATDQTFDPLMAAHWWILGAALDATHGSLLFSDACPLCECEKNVPGLAQAWIDQCCDGILAYCRQHGLVEWPGGPPAGAISLEKKSGNT